MATTFEIAMQDGTKEKIECQKFSHVIGGEKFWFALHRKPRKPGWYISHFNSGMLVGQSLAGFTNINYTKHDHLAIARQTLDRLAERAGAARMRSVIAAAMPARKKPAKEKA